MNMTKEIMRIALPNIISNITVPLMGIVSTAIAGHWGDDSTATIGALAIGVSIFNFIYWNCSFVRMGTSGLTAQAFGAGDWNECTNMLARALSVAVLMGLILVLLQYPLGELSLWAMNGGPMARDYFYARIWAVPAGILLFGFNGWFTGMQDAITPMITAICVNLIHMASSALLAFQFDLGIVGIAYGSVIAQWSGVLLASILLWRKYRKFLKPVPWSEILDIKPLKKFFVINRDIILRTLCIVMVYTFFTAASSRMDNPALLAVNTLLLQLFTLFSYMNDGFAYAAEALTGRFVGARDHIALKKCIKECLLWGVVLSIGFVCMYIGFWKDLLGIFISDSNKDAATLIELASQYIGWVIIIPIASVAPFIMDGIMVGATETQIMRNSMFFATLAYFAIYYIGYPFIGNNALWMAFTLLMVIRGILQYLMTHRLTDIYNKIIARQ